ncbi:MAG: class III signal peptide-containing protein [Methanobacterium sp.]
MNIIKDERGQGAAEYILLFGGVIVMAIAALLIYQAYFESWRWNKLGNRFDVQSEQVLTRVIIEDKTLHLYNIL